VRGPAPQEVREDYPVRSQHGALRQDHNRHWRLAPGGRTTIHTVDNSSHPRHLVHPRRGRKNLGINPSIPRDTVPRQHIRRLVKLVHHHRQNPSIDPRIPRDPREFKETTVPHQHIRRLVKLVHHHRSRQNLSIGPRDPKEFKETTALRQHIRRLVHHRRSRQNLGIDPIILRDPKGTTVLRQHMIILLNMGKSLISHHHHLLKIPTSHRPGHPSMTTIRVTALVASDLITIGV